MSKVSKLQFTRVKERKVENVSFSTVLKWILYRRIFDDLHLNKQIDHPNLDMFYGTSII